MPLAHLPRHPHTHFARGVRPISLSFSRLENSPSPASGSDSDCGIKNNYADGAHFDAGGSKSPSDEGESPGSGGGSPFAAVASSAQRYSPFPHLLLAPAEEASFENQGPSVEVRD